MRNIKDYQLAKKIKQKFKSTHRLTLPLVAILTFGAMALGYYY